MAITADLGGRDRRLIIPSFGSSMTIVALRQVYHRSSFGLIVLVSTGDGCASLLFLLTNVVLVRGVDEQGVFPRETSFLSPPGTS